MMSTGPGRCARTWKRRATRVWDWVSFRAMRVTGRFGWNRPRSMGQPDRTQVAYKSLNDPTTNPCLIDHFMA